MIYYIQKLQMCPNIPLYPSKVNSINLPQSLTESESMTRMSDERAPKRSNARARTSSSNFKLLGTKGRKKKDDSSNPGTSISLK